jgi:6-phosphogluconolactonase
MKIVRTRNMRRYVWMMLAAVLPALTGCSGFFPPITTTGGSTGGGSGTGGNTVYVGNLITTSLNGFTIGTGTLTGISGLPTKLTYQPLSMVVNPADTFLYISSTSGIHLYLINSNGTLTASTANPLPAGVYAVSMAVSPDGQWLIALDGTTQQLDIFQINSSTGDLTSSTSTSTAPYSILSGTWSPTSVVISPNGQLIFAALGTGGDAVFTFNTSTGAAVSSAILQMPTTTTADYGLAVDSNTAYVYMARSGTSGGVAVYSIGTNGALTAVTGSPFAAGTGTYSVLLDSTGTYVYAANRGDGTISGYTIGTGAKLTALAGSPYTSGTGVQALGLDRTGKYVLAVAPGGSPDLSMYSFDITTPGVLDAATSVATDADPSGASSIALTH